MRRITEFLKSDWPNFRVILTVIGVIIAAVIAQPRLWDPFRPAHVATAPTVTAPVSGKPPDTPKKRIETGSLPSKVDPEPNFFEHPWDWLLWNQRRFQPNCDSNAKDKCGQ